MTPFPSLSSFPSLPSLPSFPSIPDLASVLSPESPPLCYPAERLPRPPGNTPQSPARTRPRRASAALRTPTRLVPQERQAASARNRSPSIVSLDVGAARAAESPLYQLLPSSASMIDIADLQGDWAPMSHSPALPAAYDDSRGRRTSVVGLTAGTPSPSRPAGRRSQSAVPATRASLGDAAHRPSQSTNASPVTRTRHGPGAICSLHASPSSLASTTHAIPEELDIPSLKLHETACGAVVDPFSTQLTAPHVAGSIPSPRTVDSKDTKGAMLPPPVPGSPHSPRSSRPQMRSRPVSVVEMPLLRRASLNAHNSRRSTVSAGTSMVIGKAERAEAEVEISEVQVMGSWSLSASLSSATGAHILPANLPRVPASSDLTNRLRTLSELSSPTSPPSSSQTTPKPKFGRHQSNLPSPQTRTQARRPSHQHTHSSPVIPLLPPVSISYPASDKADEGCRAGAVPPTVSPLPSRRSSRLRLLIPAIGGPNETETSDQIFGGGLVIPRPGQGRKLSSGAMSVATLSSSAGSMTSDSTVSSSMGPNSEAGDAFALARESETEEERSSMWSRMSGTWFRKAADELTPTKRIDLLSQEESSDLAISDGSDGEEEYINYEDI